MKGAGQGTDCSSQSVNKWAQKLKLCFEALENVAYGQLIQEHSGIIFWFGRLFRLQMEVITLSAPSYKIANNQL